MGLLKGPKDRGLRSGLPRLAINMTGRLVIVKPEPTCPAAAGAEFDQIQLTGQDITDSAGVPKGSFYNHFDSKEALAVVALQRYAERRRLEDLADPSAAPWPACAATSSCCGPRPRSTGSPADACSATSAPRSPTTATSCVRRSGRT